MTTNTNQHKLAWTVSRHDNQRYRAQVMCRDTWVPEAKSYDTPCLDALTSPHIFVFRFNCFDLMRTFITVDTHRMNYKRGNVIEQSQCFCKQLLEVACDMLKLKSALASVELFLLYAVYTTHVVLMNSGKTRLPLAVLALAVVN